MDRRRRKEVVSVADAMPLPALPIYARSPVDRALADRPLDAPDNSRAWLEALRADGPRREHAVADLHELLLRWLPRLTPGGRAVMIVGKNLGADSLQRWLDDQGFPTSRLASAKGFRVLETRRS